MQIIPSWTGTEARKTEVSPIMLILFSPIHRFPLLRWCSPCRKGTVSSRNLFATKVYHQKPNWSDYFDWTWWRFGWRGAYIRHTDNSQIPINSIVFPLILLIVILHFSVIRNVFNKLLLNACNIVVWLINYCIITHYSSRNTIWDKSPYSG